MLTREHLESVSRVKPIPGIQTRHLWTNQGPVVLEWDAKTGLGVLNSAASTAFTWGYCHCFAGAMNERVGWEIVGIGGYRTEPAHFVLYSPELKDHVDIDGPGAMERYPEFQFRITKWTRKELTTHLVDYRPLNIDLAKPFVESVLMSINRQNGLTLGK